MVAPPAARSGILELWTPHRSLTSTEHLPSSSRLVPSCCCDKISGCCARSAPATGGIRTALQFHSFDEVTCGTGEDRNMTHKLISEINQASLRSDIPAFRVGDSVRVHVKVVEGNKSRVQVFAGVVVARVGSGVAETFTVRKLSYGTGVERTFPLHSPIIDKLEVERRGDVRRAKLYYLRGLRGKAAKIKEKRENA